VPIESTLPFPLSSDVLFGHHRGEAEEPPSISGHVSRATEVDQPKALHAFHLQNQKREREWAKDSALGLVQNELNQCLTIFPNVGLAKYIFSLLGGTPTCPLRGLLVPRWEDRGP
jgi:hypothetical protein